MAKLFFVRHALSENNRGVHERQPDPTLAGPGVEQSQRVASWLQDVVIPHYGYTRVVIICSAMTRALQTAKHMKGVFRVPTTVWVNWHLHEDGGLFKGKRGPKSRSPSPVPDNSDLTNEARARLNTQDETNTASRADGGRSLAVTTRQDSHAPQPHSSLAGIGWSRFKADYPDYRCVHEWGESGWYDRKGRERIYEAVARGHANADWLWNLAKFRLKRAKENGTEDSGSTEDSVFREMFPADLSEESGASKNNESLRLHGAKTLDVDRTLTILITHGMNMDSLVRVLTTASCTKKNCACVSDSIKSCVRVEVEGVDASSDSVPLQQSVDSVLSYIPTLAHCYRLTSNVGVSLLEFYYNRQCPPPLAGPDAQKLRPTTTAVERAIQHCRVTDTAEHVHDTSCETICNAGNDDIKARSPRREIRAPSSASLHDGEVVYGVGDGEEHSVGILYWNNVEFLPMHLRTGQEIGPFKLTH